MSLDRGLRRLRDRLRARKARGRKWRRPPASAGQGAAREQRGYPYWHLWR